MVKPIPKEVIDGKIVREKDRKHMSATEQKRLRIQQNLTRARNMYRRTTV